MDPLTASGGLATALALALFPCALSAGCSRRVPPPSMAGDASALRILLVRVPAALTLARALDTLSVGVDAASLGQTDVAAEPGTVLGVESSLVVFARGGVRPSEGRRSLSSTADFEGTTSTWSTARDGLPVPGVKYVAEMQVVLFETDVPPARAWDPHAGHYRALWTRTLVQAEE